MSNRGSEPTVIIFLTKHSTSFVVGKGQGWRNLQRSPLVVLGKNVCLLFILKGKRLRGELVKSSLFHPHAFNENTTFIIVILWQWGNRLEIKGTCHWTNGTPWTILSIFNIWGREVYMVWVSVIWILGSLSEMHGYKTDFSILPSTCYHSLFHDTIFPTVNLRVTSITIHPPQTSTQS